MFINEITNVPVSEVFVSATLDFVFRLPSVELERLQSIEIIKNAYFPCGILRAKFDTTGANYSCAVFSVIHIQCLDDDIILKVM